MRRINRFLIFTSLISLFAFPLLAVYSSQSAPQPPYNLKLVEDSKDVGSGFVSMTFYWDSIDGQFFQLYESKNDDKFQMIGRAQKNQYGYYYHNATGIRFTYYVTAGNEFGESEASNHISYTIEKGQSSVSCSNLYADRLCPQGCFDSSDVDCCVQAGKCWTNNLCDTCPQTGKPLLTITPLGY